jgi:glycosyltransferase involved in cell wall biosynthesis
MSRIPLSISLIARNEAHNLDRCLGSVHSWVEEIIVVINDCTDATRAVAEGYGARVYEHPWTNRRDQKNVALSHTTQPWVLALDADEEVSLELQRDIITFVTQDDPAFAGARFRRKTWFLDRWITHGEWYPDWSLRLARKSECHWGGSSEHDRLAVQGVIAELPGELLHYSFPTMDSMVRKFPDFAAGFVRDCASSNRRWTLMDTLLRPWWRFFRGYFLKGGFRDGFPGFFIAVMTAFYTFYRYSRLYEATRNKSV